MSFNNNNEVRLTTETTVRKFAEVIINGVSKGKREINGTPSLSEFSSGVAKEFGIKSFTVTVDDAPVTSREQASAPLTSDTKVAIATKESRASEDELKDGETEAMHASTENEAMAAPATEAIEGEPAPADDEQPATA